MNVQRQLILAVVTDINHSAVTYPSCTQCYTKLLIDPPTQRFHCIKCSVSVPSQSVQWRYRLVLRIADNSAVCRVVVFGRTLETYFGKTATDFHRSLMSLDRSGYPAEFMLAEALRKTFHGKYFYFGLKLQTTIGKEGALSLADVAANSASNDTSQSMLDNAEVIEHCHTLVYQMIRSNDGVYATVSDFIRFSIRQLREEKLCSGEAETPIRNNILSNSEELRCGSGHKTVNNDSSLYKSGSFHSKQKSVAFSFESSYEDSSVFQKQTGNETEADKNKLCDENEWSFKSLVANPMLCYQKDSSARFENETDKKMKNCYKSLPNLLREDSEPDSSPPYSSVEYQLNSDSTCTTQNSTCTSQKIDKELFIRALKQKSKVERTCLLSSVSMKQSSFKDEALEIDSSDAAVEPALAEKIFYNGHSSILEIEPLKHETQISNTHGLSDSAGQVQRVGDTSHRCSMSNSLNQFEKFLNMPDSEGLQTFLDDLQHDLIREPKSEDSIEACEQQTKRKTEENLEKKCIECKEFRRVNLDKNGILNDICLCNIDDSTFVPFKESEHSPKHDLKEEINQHETNFVEMHVPDSADLENFLASFEDTYISQNVDSAFETKENVVHVESSTEYDCNKNCASMNHAETFKNKMTIDDFHIDTESTGREKNSGEKFLSENKNECKSKLNLASCNTKKSGKKGGNGEFWKVSDPTSKEIDSPQCTVANNFQTIHRKFEVGKTCDESKADHDEKGDSYDSGVQLSTSGVDLFASFSSVDDGLDRNNIRSTSENSSMNKKVSQEKVDNIINEGEAEGNKYICESFEDSWSELQDDELDENLNNGLHFCFGSSEKENEGPALRGSKDTETESEKPELLLLHKSDIKNQERNGGNTFTDKHVSDEVNQSGLDSSDILFDTPEVQVSKPRISSKLTSFESFSFFTAPFMKGQNTSPYTKDLPRDDEIIKESQSSSELEKSSSQSSAELQISELGELKQCRKVMFSKKLRRISSCRLMDIKMRENTNCISKGIVRRKSCLKLNNDLMKDIEANDRLVPANTEFTLDKQEKEALNDTEEDDSFFIESSQKVPAKNTRYLLHQDAKGKGDLLTRTEKVVWNMAYVRHGIHSVSEDSMSSSRFLCNEVPVLNNIYRSHVLDTPVHDDAGTSRRCNVSHLQANSYGATPQHSNIYDSLNELDVCQFSISSDTNKSLLYRSNCHITSSKLGSPRTTCLDTPDIFDEPFNSPQFTNFPNKPFCDSENSKSGKENRHHDNSSLKTSSSRLLNDRRKTILKCLVSNTPNCDKSLLPVHVQTSGGGEYFSPDLFGEEGNSADCDSGTKSWNVSSVLCKQLFF